MSYATFQIKYGQKIRFAFILLKTKIFNFKIKKINNSNELYYKPHP